MEIKVDNRHVESLDALSTLLKGKSVTIGIDPSKSNTAIAIGDSRYKVMHMVELDCSTAENELFNSCIDIRLAIRTLFKYTTIKAVGIEALVTTKDQSRLKVMDKHDVRIKLTAIYSSIYLIMLEEFGIRPEEIGNWSWKYEVLPKHLRSADVYKGSQEFIAKELPKYARYSDDATDAICILMYMRRKSGIRDDDFVTILPDLVDPILVRYDYKLYDKEALGTRLIEAKEFEYNKVHDLSRCAALMACRLNEGCFGYAEVSVDLLSLSEIYRSCRKVTSIDTDALILYVKRLS